MRIPGIHFMPAPVAEAAPSHGGGEHAAASIPFLVGSNLYREAPFFTDVQTLDGNSHEFVHPITPGNFLRGVVLQVSATGGVLGTSATLAADAPFSIISSCSLEDISGGPILYPMAGFTAAMVQKYLRPWDGDPQKRPDFSNTINPAFTLRLMVEVRETLGVLANTDARAQYRVRYTLAPLVVAANSQFGLVSTATGVTAPAVTVNGYIQAWAQPDGHDLLDNPIDPTPDGLIASRFVQHENPALVGGNNVVRHTLVGNENRGILWIVRDSTSARKNLTDANAGAVDLRMDNRRMWKMKPSQIVEDMNWFYEQIANGTQTRETGVYAIPRFRDPGRVLGEYWWQTVEQTYIAAEFSGSDLAANVPGTLEIVYDQLAIAGELPPHLEGL